MSATVRSYSGQDQGFTEDSLITGMMSSKVLRHGGGMHLHAKNSWAGSNQFEESLLAKVLLCKEESLAANINYFRNDMNGKDATQQKMESKVPHNQSSLIIL